MPELVDTLLTVFKTSGVQSAIFAMTAAENATDRLANAEARLLKAQQNAYYGSGSMAAVAVAQRRLNISQRRETEALFTEAIASAQPFLNVLNKIVAATKSAIDETAKFGSEVMNLRAISGASGGESAGILNLFKGAGIGSGGAKEIANLNKVVFSGEGQAALQQLGISPRQGENSIQLFDAIAGKLNKMTDGWYKMRIEEKLGVEGMQELLRMSDSARGRILALSDSMGGDALPTIQKWNEANGILAVGLSTITQKIGVDLMKVFTPILLLIDFLIEKWDALDKLFKGVPTWVVTIAGLAAGFAAAAAAVVAFGGALKALKAIEEVQIVLEAIMDALAGQWKNIAAGAAVAAGAGIVMGALNAALSSQDKDNKVDDFGRHIDDFGDSVNRWRDMWGHGGKGLPTGFSANDAAHLLRMQAMGAIG